MVVLKREWWSLILLQKDEFEDEDNLFSTPVDFNQISSEISHLFLVFFLR